MDERLSLIGFFIVRDREIAPTESGWAGNEKEPQALDTLWLRGRFNFNFESRKNRHAKHIMRLCARQHFPFFV